jgi:hypothetical protein
MKHNRPTLDVPGVGRWTIESDTGEIEFVGEHNYTQRILANLAKFLDGGSKAKFIDPKRRFVLLDAQDELIRADASSGELKTVIILNRALKTGACVTASLFQPRLLFSFMNGHSRL